MADGQRYSAGEVVSGKITCIPAEAKKSMVGPGLSHSKKAIAGGDEQCPDCRGMMVRAGSCFYCPGCGFSHCRI